MKFLFPILALSGCSLNPLPRATQAPAPDVSGVLSIIGRFGMAHACPVGERLALTNAHVADLRPFQSDVPLFPLNWSDELGNSGVLEPIGVEKGRDIAVMKPADGVFSRHYEVATTSPAPGDVVFLVGYDWSRKNAFAPRLIRTTVQRVVADHLVLEDAGEPGSSGSCVFNQSGEVVGINAWGVETQYGGQQVGVAVRIWKQ